MLLILRVLLCLIFVVLLAMAIVQNEPIVVAATLVTLILQIVLHDVDVADARNKRDALLLQIRDKLAPRPAGVGYFVCPSCSWRRTSKHDYDCLTKFVNDELAKLGLPTTP